MYPRVATCLLGLLALANGLALPRHATELSPAHVSATQYDFIIVGGGMSGLTVADRLSEDPKVKVLVVEAGPFDQGEEGIVIPGAYNPSPYLWFGLNSQPQTALNNRTFLATCARVVGGGSTINAMVFLRGGKTEYAAWEELGAEGWNWDGLLPYFKKSENLTLPSPEFAAEANISWVEGVHGGNGPVQASYPNYFFPSSENWWSAALSSGLTPTEDVNGGSPKGLAWFPTAVDATSRTRSSARINHYDRVKDSRDNYHILANHTTSRVLFKGKRAIGVEYLPTAGGRKVRVYASKEVILAAGAVHTPQVLQLSGIGPKKLLDKLNISIMSDLPGVGANFQDQPSLSVPYNFTNNAIPNTDTLNTNSTFNAEQRALYDSEKSGAYTIVRGLSTTLALPPLKNATSDWATIIATAREQDPTAWLPVDTHPSVEAGYRAQREIILSQLEGPDVPIGMIHWPTGNSVTLYFFKPLSRGTIAIKSTDPLAQPLIDFRTATDPADFDLFTALFRKNREIMAAPDMEALGPREAAPFGKDIKFNDELKKIFAGRVASSTAHECCTAAMLPKDLGGVVDPRMRVYGVKGLRVVDTSFWPIVLTAAPTGTTYAAAEKIADIIKQDYLIAPGRLHAQ